LEIEGYLPDEMCEPVYRIIIGEHPAIGQKIGKAHGAYGQTDTVIEGVRAQIFGSQEDGYLVIVKAAVGCQDYGVFTKNQVENLILGDREIERLGLFDSLQTAISYVKSKHNLR
jgi:hypothetical protein